MIRLLLLLPSKFITEMDILKIFGFPNIDIKSVKGLIFCNFLPVYLQNFVMVAGTAAIKSKVFRNSFGKLPAKPVLFATFLKNELFYMFSCGSLLRF